MSSKIVRVPSPPNPSSSIVAAWKPCPKAQTHYNLKDSFRRHQRNPSGIATSGSPAEGTSKRIAASICCRLYHCPLEMPSLWSHQMQKNPIRAKSFNKYFRGCWLAGRNGIFMIWLTSGRDNQSQAY